MGISVQQWKDFSRLAEEGLGILKDTDEILGVKKAKMLALKAEYETANASRKTAIQTEFQNLAKEYAEAETKAVEATHNMLTKEKAMAQVLAGEGLTHSSWNPLHHFMVRRNMTAVSQHAETLGELRLVTPGKNGLLRFGFSKGNMVLMGVGVGLVAYANRGLMNEGAKHDLERMAWGLVPVVGGSMDIHDAWKDFSK
jgi:hypothetical protein